MLTGLKAAIKAFLQITSKNRIRRSPEHAIYNVIIYNKLHDAMTVPAGRRRRFLRLRRDFPVIDSPLRHANAIISIEA